MKLEELAQTEDVKGTYAALRLSDESKQMLQDWADEVKLPNATKPEKYHVTLLYSRKHLPNYVSAGDLDEPYVGKPKGFDVWNTTPEDPDERPSRALVLEFDCPELVKRHEFLMDEHDATYDYPDYKTHITLSYDIGEMEPNDLPAITEPIYLNHEYREDLDLNWAKNKGVEKK